jgi:hypothetical protein
MDPTALPSNTTLAESTPRPGMALQCEDETSPGYRLGTDWWSSEDQGLLLTLGINCAVTCVVLLVYACLSRRPSWRQIFSPNANMDTSKHPLIRESDPCVNKLIGHESKTRVKETLEHVMMQCAAIPFFFWPSDLGWRGRERPLLPPGAWRNSKTL